LGKYIIEFYHRKDGSCPVEEFLDSLDFKHRAKMLKSIQLIEEFGIDLREPYSKPLGEGIFEFRAKLGSDIMRVLYFFHARKCVVLTNGFLKKTQKTPKAVLEFAWQCRADYLEGRRNTNE
jgi:phage-related protein